MTINTYLVLGAGFVTVFAVCLFGTAWQWLHDRTKPVLYWGAFVSGALWVVWALGAVVWLGVR